MTQIQKNRLLLGVDDTEFAKHWMYCTLELAAFFVLKGIIFSCFFVLFWAFVFIVLQVMCLLHQVRAEKHGIFIWRLLIWYWKCVLTCLMLVYKTSFQEVGKLHLPTIYKRPRAFWLLIMIGQKKFIVLFCPVGEQQSKSHFRVFFQGNVLAMFALLVWFVHQSSTCEENFHSRFHQGFHRHWEIKWHVQKQQRHWVNA